MMVVEQELSQGSGVDSVDTSGNVDELSNGCASK